LKRSNRLVLLVGIFLAVIAFVGVALLLQGGGGTPGEGPTAEPTTATVVVAAEDIPLGAEIQQDQVRTIDVPVTEAPPGALTNVIQAIGQTARERVTAGQPITTGVITDTGALTDIEVPPGFVAMAVQVDQVTGVGTVIKTGDYVDMVVGFNYQVVLPPTEDQAQPQVLSGVNPTSVKLLLQGMQVLGALLPPQPAADGGTTTGEQPPGDQPTSLTGQQEIVILAVTPQQAEVIKFAQIDGNISLVLRSAQEFFDPATGEPVPGPVAATTGIILRILVDEYGVLVPELVEAVLPETGNP